MTCKWKTMHHATPVVIFLLFLIGFLILFSLVTIPVLTDVSYTTLSTPHYVYSPMNEKCACNRSNTKIFNLGLHKSGTESLNNLLTQMGCNSVHFLAWPQDVNFTKINPMITTSKLLKYRFVATLIEGAKQNNKSLLYYFSDQTNAISEMNLCQGHLCLYPNLVDYALLDRQYPNALFILTYRDTSSHFQSIDHWINMRSDLIYHDVPYLPLGTGNTHDYEITQWIQGHYQRVTQYFSNMSDSKFIKFKIGEDHVDKLKGFLHCYGNYTMPHDNAMTNELRERLNKYKSVEPELYLERCTWNTSNLKLRSTATTM
eukprot:599986_1